MDIYLEKLKSFSIENKYFSYYCSIIENSKEKYQSKKSAKSNLGYVEDHHIFPSCFCNEEEKIDKNNRCYLTAKEHFIVHRLLTKFINNKEMLDKMIFAVWNMTRKSKGQERYLITSSAYNILKESMAETKRNQIVSIETREKISRSLKGRKLPPRSEEYKKNMSLSKKGTKMPEEYRKELSMRMSGEGNNFYGKKHTNDTRKHLSEVLTGSTKSFRTDEHREKLSKALSGRKLSDFEKEKRKDTYLRGEDHPYFGGLPDHMFVCCEYCNKRISKSMHTRWHGEKCKHKNA
jgi:hypothetical protein